MQSLLGQTYAWTIKWSDGRFGLLVIFIFLFLDASIFPLPTTVIFITISLIQPSRSYYNTLIATAAMAIGSIVGYSIGHYLRKLHRFCPVSVQSYSVFYRGKLPKCSNALPQLELQYPILLHNITYSLPVFFDYRRSLRHRYPGISNLDPGFPGISIFYSCLADYQVWRRGEGNISQKPENYRCDFGCITSDRPCCYKIWLTFIAAVGIRQLDYWLIQLLKAFLKFHLV